MHNIRMHPKLIGHSISHLFIAMQNSDYNHYGNYNINNILKLNLIVKYFHYILNPNLGDINDYITTFSITVSYLQLQHTCIIVYSL